VRHRGRRISQDLANGLLEYAAVAEAMPAERRRTARVLEIGGGYGRLAWVWLAAHPGVRVVMVDIPPALALAQEYLTRLFFDRPAARFRADADPAALHAEVLASELAFLTPNQLEALDPLGADVALNVSSLHEMSAEQIARYLELIDRHAAGGFLYTKQWRRRGNPLDDVVTARETYPYPERWRALFDRVHPVQVRFFEALFAL
jgi:putative sugar O-methyltransferase